MNQRIQALAEHCDFYVGNEHYDKSHQEQQQLFMQKFAQLIVAAVITELEDAKKCDPYTGELLACEKNTILTEQIEWLQEYFGVEE